MEDLTGVRYRTDSGTATIELARPGSSNAIDLPTARSFGTAVDRAAADPAVRVVLLRGEGERFCAGGDVASMATSADPAAHLHELAETLDDALQRLGRLDKPVVAAVQGAAAGAGLALVLTADLVLSARSARYLTAYAGVGLTPDCGLSWLLPRAVGQQRALELVLTPRALTAEEALAWGVVTRVVDDEILTDAAVELCTQLAAAPPFALGQARRLLRSAWDVSRADAGADESRTIARAVTTPEAQARIERFRR